MAQLSFSQSEGVPRKEVVCSTETVRKTTFKWEVKDFQALFSKGHRERAPDLLSPPFTSLGGKVWRVKLVDKGCAWESRNETNNNPLSRHMTMPVTTRTVQVLVGHKFGVQLVLESSSTQIWAQFKVSFNPSISECAIMQSLIMQRVLSATQPARDHDGVSRYGDSALNETVFTVYNSSNAMSQNPSGSITLFCEINEKVDPIHSLSGVSTESPNIGSADLQTDFEKLLESGEFSDVTLITSDRRFKAHKNILSTRSPVLKKMLTVKMKKKTSNKVTISEMDSDAVQEMLTFIYTGTAPNIDEPNMADQLLYAADKYELLGLKEISECELECNLDVENAVHLLIKAHIHHADRLKRSCIGLITANCTEVRETDDWERLKHHPELYEDILGMAFPTANKRARIAE